MIECKDYKVQIGNGGFIYPVRGKHPVDVLSILYFHYKGRVKRSKFIKLTNEEGITTKLEISRSMLREIEKEHQI